MELAVRIVAYLFWAGLIFFFGFMQGEKSERAKYECWCGDTQSCAFGPGVIGTKHCSGDRTWSACEPDPRYRVREVLP